MLTLSEIALEEMEKMQKLKVKEVKPMAKDGTLLIGEDDTKCSGFLPELKDVKPGDTVEVELEVKGRYTNIKACKVLDHTAPPAASAPAPYAPKPCSDHAVDDSKYRMTALMCAINLAKTSTISVDNIQAEALKFYLWLKNPGNKQALPPVK